MILILPGPRIRAPLGMKTTNAKTKTFQTPAAAPEKDLEKIQVPKSTIRRAKKITHVETVKLQVHGDESPLADREVEYCPPNPKSLPYDSEDFPRNCLNYDVLKPENLMRGIYATYHNRIDDNGLTQMDRDYQASYEKSARECDKKVLAMMDEDWTIGDVPETFHHIRKKSQKLATVKASVQSQKLKIPVEPKPIGTIASRNAALALSVLPKAGAPTKKSTVPTKGASFQPSFLSRSKPVPPPTNSSTIRNNAATAASKSTIGYTKGRSTASAVHANSIYTNPAPYIVKRKTSPIAISISNVSQSSERSDTTVTPAKFLEDTASNSDKWSRLEFLGAFDGHDGAEISTEGGLSELLKGEDEEEFFMTLGEDL